MSGPPLENHKLYEFLYKISNWTPSPHGKKGLLPLEKSWTYTGTFAKVKLSLKYPLWISRGLKKQKTAVRVFFCQMDLTPPPPRQKSLDPRMTFLSFQKSESVAVVCRRVRATARTRMTKEWYFKIKIIQSLYKRKPILRGLRTTKTQTSLRIRAGWSAPFLFAFLESIIYKLATNGITFF